MTYEKVNSKIITVEKSNIVEPIISGSSMSLIFIVMFWLECQILYQWQEIGKPAILVTNSGHPEKIYHFEK